MKSLNKKVSRYKNREAVDILKSYLDAISNDDLHRIRDLRLNIITWGEKYLPIEHLPTGHTQIKHFQSS